MQVKQDHPVSSPYLMIMLMTVMCVAVLGMIALANGYVPFSPSFFVSYPLSAASCYLLLLGMGYRFEIGNSPYSARPYLTEDPQSFFNIYLLIATIWFLGVIPVFWLKMGQLALQGASIDEMVYQNRYLCILVTLGGGLSYLLRKKAVEQKDIYRVNRSSPMVQQSRLHIDIPPGWSHSDVWEAVSVSEQELQTYSDRDRSHYEKRREEKLKKDTQEVEVFRASGISEFLEDRAAQFGNRDSKLNSHIRNDHSHIDDVSILPSWLSSDSHKAYDYPESSVRRSIGDFDTRFEQSIIPTHEVLADNISWSGISRPIRKPKASTINQDELEIEDISECPTTPPQAHPSQTMRVVSSKEDLEEALNAEQDPNTLDQTYNGSEKTDYSESGTSRFVKAESLEDQILFEQVLEVIGDTHIHINICDSQNDHLDYKRMSFNSLDGIQEDKLTQVAFGAIDSE